MTTTKTKSKKIVKPVRLRQLLKAIKTRRAKGGRPTQADYAVALDRVVRAIGRSTQQGATVTIHAVRVL